MTGKPVHQPRHEVGADDLDSIERPLQIENKYILSKWVKDNYFNSDIYFGK